MTSDSPFRDALRQNELFSSLDEDELHALVQLASEVSLEPNEILFNEGDDGSDMFVILSGTIRLSILDPDGRMQPTALLGKAQTLGEMAVLDGSPRSATATSTANTLLARIDRPDLDSLAQQFPGAQAKVLTQAIRLVSARLRKSNTDFWDLVRSAMRQKRRWSQSQATFLSLVSHELRTPLAIIKSSAQLVLRSSNADRSVYLGKIVEQSNHLSALIEDLITLSVLQSETGLDDVMEFDAVALSQQTVEDSAEPARKRDIDVSLRSPTHELRIEGDPRLLARAIHHLIDNAVKFSPRSSEVVVSLDRNVAGLICVSVIDRGEGIPATRLDSLLERFVQVQSPLNRDAEGLGIGLSLVDEIARAHGGRLTADSQPGRGSRFTIAIPDGAKHGVSSRMHAD